MPWRPWAACGLAGRGPIRGPAATGFLSTYVARPSGCFSPTPRRPVAGRGRRAFRSPGDPARLAAAVPIFSVPELVADGVCSSCIARGAGSCAGSAAGSSTQAGTTKSILGSGRSGARPSCGGALASPGEARQTNPAAYERLLEAMLQAETQATEAGTARLLQLVERLDRRRRMQFTL